MDRRKFLKNSAITALGSMIIPPKLLNGMRKPSVENMLKPSAKPNVLSWRNDEINIAWIGHATVLINF